MIARQLRTGVIAATCVLATAHLFAISGLFVALFPALYGVALACGMVSGINAASPSAWQRKPGRIESVLVHGSILALILTPSLFVGWQLGALAFLASASLTFAAMGATWRFTTCRAGAPSMSQRS